MRFRRQVKTFLDATHGVGLRHLSVSLRYAIGSALSPGTDAEHLAATVGWLRLAQDVTGCGGVSAVTTVELATTSCMAVPTLTSSAIPA